MPIEAEYTFIDNNGRRAATRLFLPFDLGTLTQVEGLAISLGEAMQALSTAHLERIRLQAVIDREVSAPGPLSDCFRRVSLFFRNNTRRYALAIPSPGALPVDTAGPYRGSRITRTSLELSGLLDFVQGLTTGLLSPDGESAPSAFTVGSITRNQL